MSSSRVILSRYHKSKKSKIPYFFHKNKKSNSDKLFLMCSGGGGGNPLTERIKAEESSVFRLQYHYHNMGHIYIIYYYFTNIFSLGLEISMALLLICAVYQDFMHLLCVA